MVDLHTETVQNNEADLGHLLEVLDTALASDNPIVQDQLRKLLMIAALATTKNPDAAVAGPLSSLLGQIKSLWNEIAALKRQIEALQPRYKKEMLDHEYMKYKKSYEEKKFESWNDTNDFAIEMLKKLKEKTK